MEQTAAVNETIHHRFAQRAQDASSAWALEDVTGRIDYHELSVAADRLARWLLGCGVTPHARVGLLLGRSPEMVIAMLAVLKTGAAYLPLDPLAPRERIRFLLHDSRAALVVAGPDLVHRLPHGGPPSLVLKRGWREEREARDEPAHSPPLPVVAPDDPAYVIYTSGSTGTPKGVQVSHRNVLSLIDAGRDLFGLTADDVWTFFHSAVFDFSVWEIWGGLLHGASVVIVPYEVSRSPQLFLDLLHERSVTVLNQTPSAFHQLIRAEAQRQERLTALRYVVFGGEALDPRSLEPWIGRYGDERPRLVNMFGITETTVHVTFRRVRQADLGGGRSLIGRAIPGWRLHLLDDALQPVQEGQPGEIFVGGAGVTGGYIERPDLTAERFVPDPASNGGRLYRSGDRGRLDADGELEYLGRLDAQVKIRGHRIELGEVRQALAAQPGIDEVAVVARDTAASGPRLVAYAVVQPESLAAGLSGDVVAEHLANWRTLYDAAYGPGGGDDDFVGWNSSYTGEPIARDEMESWRAATVERILSLRPRRVLEIGAGTGLLVSHLAPRVTSYRATDISERAVERLRRCNAICASGTPVRVEARAATDFRGLEGERFDTIVLNSVVQYFPSLDYLVAVLHQAVAVLEPGGAIFLGDLRNLTLLRAFHASLELHRAAPESGRTEVAGNVEAGVSEEDELLIAPAFFGALGQSFERVSRVRVLPKEEPADNELTRYRYDIALELDGQPPSARLGRWIDVRHEGLSPAALYRRLRTEEPPAVGLRNIPNPRLQGDLAALAWLAGERDEPTTGDLRSALCQSSSPGIGCRELRRLAGDLGYTVELSWAADHPEGGYDAVLSKSGEAVADLPAPPGCREGGYANEPLVPRRRRARAVELRRRMATILPEYMVPSQVVILPAMPLNLNGKVDVGALPAPRGIRHEVAPYVEANDADSRRLVEIWQEVLGLDAVGIHDDFFELGGNSLDLVHAAAHADRQGLNLTAADFLAHPTIAGVLAARLGPAVEPAAVPGGPAAPQPHPVVGMELAAADAEAVFPLTPMQQGMLYHTLRDPAGQPYLVQFAFEIHGALHAETFVHSCRQVVARHPMLRASFHWQGEAPLQVVHGSAELPFRIDDLSDLEPVAQQVGLQEAIEADRRSGFDLERPPQVRFALSRLGPERHHLLFSHMHLVMSEWELRQVFREVFELHAAAFGRPLPELFPGRPFEEFVALLDTLDRGRMEEFWRDYLAGAEPSRLAPSAGRRGIGRGVLEAQHPLSRDLSRRLRDLARDEAVSLNTVLTAACALLLARHTGADDLLFGITMSGRGSIAGNFATTVGLFLNTVPIRLHYRPTATLSTWLREIQQNVGVLTRHEHSALVDISRWTGRAGATELFETLLVFDDEPLDAYLNRLGLDLEIGSLEIFEETNYPVTFAPMIGETVLVRVLGNPEHCDREILQALADRFAAVLGQMADQGPRASLNRLSLLSASDRQGFAQLNATRLTYPQDDAIHRLFERQAARTPERVALCCGSLSLCYGELNVEANRLAHHLVSQGVGRGDRVAIYLQRSPELLVGLLAILKAGAAYLPLALEDPPLRLAATLADAAPSMVLTETHLAPRLPEGAARLCLDSARRAIAAEPDGDLESDITGVDSAYLTYTSGSTGRPKGVLIPHRAVLRLVCGARFADLGADQVLLHMAPVAFDASTFEIWGALLNGSRLVVMPPGDVSLDDLERTITARGVTTLWLSAGLFQLVVQERPTVVSSLRQLLFGGDVTPVATVERASGAVGCTLINGYGPTENTTFTATYRVPTGFAGEETLPIGRPVANTRTYVVDRYGALCPVGVAGELLTGGDGLALGYWRDPGRTAESFVPDPFGDQPGERLYRTGDLASLSPDGHLRFLGRADEQLKIRGFRVEPGEIEAALLRHPAIAQALVVPRRDERGEPILVAYFCAAGADAPAAAEIGEMLTRAFPSYMVPDRFVALAKLPLTGHGKIDRRALPAPDLVPPLTPAAENLPLRFEEEILHGIWKEVLGRDEIGLHDDFFTLGGHSLRATQIIARIRSAFAVELSFADFFVAPTIHELALQIARQQTPDDAMPTIVSSARDCDAPLSFAQQRLWFLDLVAPGNPAYNIVTIFRLRGPLDETALQAALTAITVRHESLRTRFLPCDGQPVQRIDDPRPAVLHIVDGPSASGGDGAAAIREISRVENLWSFDLTAGPLLRSTLLRLGPGERVLWINLHHIVADGWSVGVFNRELGLYYRAALGNEPAVLPDLPIQYADFALGQRQWLEAGTGQRQLAHWRRELAGLQPLALPLDHQRPGVQSFAGRQVPLHLPLAPTTDLERRSRRHNATLFMTLAGAFFTLLHRYSGQTDLALGSPIANRARRETENLIGFFVNTLVLRLRLADSWTFDTLLGRLRETALAAYAYQELPFEQVVDALAPQRNSAQNPLVQVVFALQNAPMPPPVLDRVEVEPLGFAVHTARFDLEVHLWRVDAGLKGMLIYNPDLFEEATVAGLARHYGELLLAILRQPAAELRDLSLLGVEERRQVLATGLDPHPGSYPREATVPALFGAQAARRPSAVALVEGDLQLSYGDLDGGSSRLAWVLRRLGVGLESPVAVCMRRGSASIVALLAILKAGGFYLPLHPDDPPRRLRSILEATATRIVLTHEGADLSLPEEGEGGPRRLYLDAENDGLAAASDAGPLPVSGPANLCYLMHTSGSTGQPQGVAVPHCAVVRLVVGASYVRLDESEVVLHLAPLTFDASTFEIWGALLNGARLVLATPERPSLQDLANLIRSQGVTTAWLTASLFHLMVDQQVEGLRGLRQLLAGGDVLSPARIRKVLEEAPGCRVINGYGPTENTTFTCCHPVDRSDLGERVPIGRAISGSTVFVLDSRLEPVPDGVCGELYTGGDGLARGYWGSPAATAASFLPDPWSELPGSRLYRTRDWVRRRADGALDFIGRTDDQVKVRGFRIEPRELEICLTRHPVVQDALILSQRAAGGETSLVAYVVPAQGTGAAAGPLASGQRSSWAKLFDEQIYARSLPDPAFNIAGWNDSYTGMPIPDPQMRQWLDSRIEWLLSHRPRRILEIGCGTGLLLLRIAPFSERYVGTDISRTALAGLASYLEQRPIPQIELRLEAADEMGDLGRDAFDACILNSTIQYFPGVDYLLAVLEKVIASLRPGGMIYLGDVRNLATQRAFYAGVALARAGDDAPRDTLRRLMRQRAYYEPELLLDPRFFAALPGTLPRVTTARIELQRGRVDNELTRHRYDVTLYLDRGPAAAPQREIVLGAARHDAGAATLRAALRQRGDEELVVRGLPNPRLAGELAALEWLEGERGPDSAGSWRAQQRRRGVDAPWPGPDDLVELGRELGLDVETTWARSGDPGRFDATFRRPITAPPAPVAALSVARGPSPVAELRRWVNVPLQEQIRALLTPQLREHVSRSLPDYMVPADFVVLSHLPLTASGKVDRRALPQAQDLAAPAKAGGSRLPETATELAIAEVWREALGVGEVDCDDNFFDIGGNSLMLIRVCSLLGKALDREIAVVDLFAFPTIRKLGRHLSAQAVRGSDERHQASQRRAHQQAQAYRDAYPPQRRRRRDE